MTDRSAAAKWRHTRGTIPLQSIPLGTLRESGSIRGPATRTMCRPGTRAVMRGNARPQSSRRSHPIDAPPTVHITSGPSPYPNSRRKTSLRGFSEIRWKLFLRDAWMAGGIQKLPAVFTLYSFVLNFFSAEGTLLHYHLLWNIQLSGSRLFRRSRAADGY
jgi:hypothetical protein